MGDENDIAAAAASAPKLTREQMLAIYKKKKEETAEKLKGSKGTAPARRPLQAANSNVANPPSATAQRAVTRLSLRGTASANPGPLLTPRAEPKPPRSLPKPNIDPAAKSASHYDLRSRTAPVNKIRRDFDVYGSASRGSTSKVGSTTKVAAKAPKQTPTPSQRASRSSPPRVLGSLDDLFANPSTPSLSRLPDLNSPPKQDDRAMVLEEIGSPIHGTSPRGMRSSRLSEGIFGSRSGLRPRPLASSASSALSSPTRNGPSAQTTSLGEDALTSSLLMREELNETKDALDTALRRLHERETELETVRELQETEIERLRILHESEVETLKDEHAMALEKLRVRHESQLAAFGANADEMAKNLDAKDAELQAVLLERARLEDLVNELRQDLETSKAQIASIRIPSKALAAVASSMAPTSATPTTPLSAGHPTFAFASPASPAALFVSAPNTPLPPTPSPSTPLAFHVAAQTVSLPSTPETPAVRRAEIEALKKELEDAYEVISILEAREDWVDPEEVRAEEERLRKVIEDLDDKVMEQEIQAFKAQKELALESKRLEETKEFLEQALKENQELHERFASGERTVSSSAQMTDCSTQTDEHSWDRLFAEANKAITLARLIKFGNSAMYQQMLENNEEFKTAFEELAEQLRQEKDNNQVLMSMQEQLLANLQESYEDGEEMEDEGEGEEEDGGETPVAELEDATVPGVCDTPRPVRSPPRGAA